jgi:hypothetical protein
MYKITGIGFCGVGSVNIFPDTMSAIVVLSSGLNAGDPSDFTAALLMQEVFDLKSRVEILPRSQGSLCRVEGHHGGLEKAPQYFTPGTSAAKLQWQVQRTWNHPGDTAAGAGGLGSCLQR